MESEKAARRVRTDPSTDRNWPPAYSREDEAASARTWPSARWFQASTAPAPAAETAASRERAAPPTEANSPPR